MKKLKLILSILLFSFSFTNAQNSGTIKGQVFDEDKNPMPSVHVYVEVAGNKQPIAEGAVTVIISKSGLNPEDITVITSPKGNYN